MKVEGQVPFVGDEYVRAERFCDEWAGDCEAHVALVEDFARAIFLVMDYEDAVAYTEENDAEIQYDCDRTLPSMGRASNCASCSPWTGATTGSRSASTKRSKETDMRNSPEWLHDRVNDPYGTPSKHPFWETVTFEVVGVWKVFERDGKWYGYKTTQNAWTTPRPSREDVVQMATGPQVDIWALPSMGRASNCASCSP